MGTPAPGHIRSLVRDVLVFQCKLLLDALRDIILSPLTLAAGLADLLLARQQSPRYFLAVVRFGRRSDEVIDLWSTAFESEGTHAGNVDLVLARIEEAMRDPRTGARRMRVLKRWAERELARKRRHGGDASPAAVGAGAGAGAAPAPAAAATAADPALAADRHDDR